MANKPDIAVTSDDDEYEVVNSTRGLTVQKPRKENVRCPEVIKPNGKKAQFIISGLDGEQVQELHDADKVYEKGEWTGRWDRSYQKIKLIAVAARDSNGHRLWHSMEAAIAEIKGYPIAVIDRLEAAAQRMSAASVEAEAKKSETTPTSSSGTN
jgi:hypothetical protein